MEDFVPFDLAKKLKEKGFPIKTKTEGKFGLTKVKKIEILPTISQVLKWLREKEISIEPCATPYSYWYYMIKEKGTIKVTYTGENYNNYEQAAIAGVNYCLDKLI